MPATEFPTGERDSHYYDDAAPAIAVLRRGLERGDELKESQ